MSTRHAITSLIQCGKEISCGRLVVVSNSGTHAWWAWGATVWSIG